jgi:hypothetical protein
MLSDKFLGGGSDADTLTLADRFGSFIVARPPFNLDEDNDAAALCDQIYFPAPPFEASRQNSIALETEEKSCRSFGNTPGALVGLS